MNLAALRSLRSTLSLAFVAAASLFLASCGGGGASSTSTTGNGALELLPSTGSFYAGVPYTLNIRGGRAPYLVTSDQQTILPLNFTTSDNSFSFVANNPGVIDTGLEEGEVPRRTVNVQVRDSLGTSITAVYSVLQNFFTGYGEAYSNTCATSGLTQPQACSGTDTIITLYPISNGALYGGREYQFDRIRGDFNFVQEPLPAVPQLLDTIRATTDHVGKIFLRVRVAVNAPSQIATYKVTDVRTGVSTMLAFIIVQQAPSGTLTIVPGGSVTFTGRSAGECGWGASDQYLWDGTPPYTIIPVAGVSVTPTTVTEMGGRFTISVGQGAPVTACPRGNVVVSDAQGRRATIAVTSQPGTTSIPIAVAPVPLPALTCTLNSLTAAVIGGIGPLSVVSNHPRVNAMVSGNVLSVFRAPNGDGAVVYPATYALAITDGATILTLSGNAVSANCP